MKAFTDLEQSKKLTGILPLESADMHYNNASTKGTDYVGTYRAELMDYNTAKEVMSIIVNAAFEIIPCWSLAALLDILDYPQLRTLGGEKIRWMTSVYPPNDCRYDSCWHDNPVDACYEIIVRLNDLKLLYYGRKNKRLCNNPS